MFANTQINSVAFTPEEVEQNLHMDLIAYLLSYNQKSKHSYFDIHITSDGFCTIVEFVNLTYDINSETEGFVFMDEEHYLLKRVEFPDGHYDYFNDDEVDDAFNEWLGTHPGWDRDIDGRWHNKQEEEYINKINKMSDGGCVCGDTDGDRKAYTDLMEDDDE